MSTVEASDELLLALAKVCETAICENGTRPAEIMSALYSLMTWVIANIDPECHEKIAAEIVSNIPKMLRRARATQAEWGTAASAAQH